MLRKVLVVLLDPFREIRV